MPAFGWTPWDVIEEYTRPAKIVEHGRVVVKEALSEPEMVDVPGVGTLESLNTDGLRSLVHTLKVPFMKEKTLRWPGVHPPETLGAVPGLLDRVLADLARGVSCRASVSPLPS